MDPPTLRLAGDAPDAPAGPLPEASISREYYVARGYLTLRNRFPPGEVEAWQEESERLWRHVHESDAAHRLQYREHESGTRVPDRIDPLLDVSPLFSNVAADPRILEPVARLLGEPPAVMKAKLITKRPGTQGYGLHQDYPYWAALGVPADAMLSVLVAVDPASAENGALEVWPGLHHGILPPPPGDPFDVDESLVDLNAGELIALEAGDLLAFHSLVPHRSGANRSAHSRRAVFLTYVGASHRDAASCYEQARLTLR